jgi:hypothetical protein
LPPAAVLAEFQQQILVRIYTRDLPTLIVTGLIVGWLLGGLTGFVRRDLRDETLTLLDAVDLRRAGRTRWFERNDSSAQAGVLAGLICGGLMAFTSLANAGNAFSVSMGLDTIELGLARHRWLARRNYPAPCSLFCPGWRTCCRRSPSLRCLSSALWPSFSLKTRCAGSVRAGWPRRLPER